MTEIDDELARIREKINSIKQEVNSKDAPVDVKGETIEDRTIDMHAFAENIRVEVGENLKKELERAKSEIEKSKQKIKSEIPQSIPNPENFELPIVPILTETQKLVSNAITTALASVEVALKPLENLGDMATDFSIKEKELKKKAKKLEKLSKKLKKARLKLEIDGFDPITVDLGHDDVDIDETIDEAMDQFEDTIEEVVEMVEEVAEEMEDLEEEIGEIEEEIWENDEEGMGDTVGKTKEKNGSVNVQWDLDDE